VAEATKFRKAMLQATDEGLAIFGESVGRAVYYHVEQSYRVKPEEIPKKLKAFHNALESIFGAGAIVLEKRIARNLYNSLALNFTEHENWTLVNYANHAQKISKRIK